MALKKPTFTIVSPQLKQQFNGTWNDIQIVNNVLARVLCIAKDMIEEHSQAGNWDVSKTTTNPFELVYKTRLVDNIVPVSRSFFKLIEMLVDHDLSILKSGTFGYIAEAPGGFIQAMVEFRSRYISRHPGDRHVGMTLMSSGRHTPSWKLSSEWMTKHRVSFCNGSDGTGNVYNIENLIMFSKTFGDSKFDMITADGGFDFSGNFNLQEQNVLKMILCECLCAILSLNEGGYFILKTFDLLTLPSFSVVQILCTCFKEVLCTKPMSSRAANSEKYIVCKSFRTQEAARVQGRLIEIIQNSETDGWMQTFTEYFPCSIETAFRITLLNISTVMRQLYSINKTLMYIKRLYEGPSYIHNNTKQVMLAKLWSEKYCLPYKLTHQDITPTVL
jgi:23S rRNA U2552 (ribose-2'-O)-methylase RlmE/FtsJ